MRSILLVLACLFLSVSASFAQSTGFAPDISLDRLVELETRIVPNRARPGEHVRLVTTAKVKSGWHIYSVQPQGEFGPQPTHVTTEAPGLQMEGPPYETNPAHEKDVAFGMDLWFHKLAARFYQNLAVPSDTQASSAPLVPGTTGLLAQRLVHQRVVYQTCNDRFCTPAKTATLSAMLTLEPGPVRPEYATMLRTVDYLDNSGQFQLDADSLDGALAQGLPGFLLLAAGFGFLALLTPCVFPMIPVTVTFFTGQTRAGKSGDSKGGIGLAALFGLGLIVSYTGLGLGMTFLLGASGAGRFATSPWVNLAVAGFFVIFALALVGWITPALPGTIVRRLDDSARRIQGPAGVLLMGVAFTAANFTCTMPFVGTLLLAASSGQVLWPLVGMLVFSTVFALPFVALALFPRWMVTLRGRSGPWLTQVKIVLGLIEMGAALKFFSNADVVWGWGVLNREVLLGAWAVIALGCAAVLLLGLPAAIVWPPKLPRTNLRKPFLAAPSVGFMILAGYLTWGIVGAELDTYTEAYLPPRVGLAVTQATGHGDETVARLPWSPSLEQALVAAKLTGKPVFVDFTGYTCVNCRWMEKKVFAKPAVLDAFRQRFVLAQLYTDGGPDGEKNQRLQVERFRTLAMPYYVILAPDNAVLATHAGILPSVPGFLEFLDQGTRSTRAQSTAGDGAAPRRS